MDLRPEIRSLMTLPVRGSELKGRGRMEFMSSIVLPRTSGITCRSLISGLHMQIVPFTMKHSNVKSDKQMLSVDFLHLRDYDLLKKSLTVADIVFFGGTCDMVEELAPIAQKTPGKIIVLTLGADGSMAFLGRETFTQAALPLEKVVDTAGCGDAFQAGFTANYYQNQDIEQALSAGAKLGRKAAMSYGGTPWKAESLATL